MVERRDCKATKGLVPSEAATGAPSEVVTGDTDWSTIWSTERGTERNTEYSSCTLLLCAHLLRCGAQCVWIVLVCKGMSAWAWVVRRDASALTLGRRSLGRQSRARVLDKGFCDAGTSSDRDTGPQGCDWRAVAKGRSGRRTAHRSLWSGRLGSWDRGPDVGRPGGPKSSVRSQENQRQLCRPAWTELS